MATATIVCSNCDRVITVIGPPPKVCPTCGCTLDNAADATHTLERPLGLPETIIEALGSPREKFGRYEVVRKLGSGGFGTVYLTWDPQLKRNDAIKVPDVKKSKNPEAVERFAREGRSSAQLRHPNIVRIYTVEEDRGVLFIVSEYVEGEPLSRQLKKERLPIRTGASIVATIAAAVNYAHSKGIIHRDIKPGNIMIDVAGNPRLMDFGLAKHEETDPTVTIEDQVIGTPAYMSPEQARGKSKEIDRRTDVYSLGATLYHLLTNELPYRGNVREVRDKILAEEPKRPRAIDKQIPLDLETVCLKAMEKEPARRYQTAAELGDDLERWLRGEPVIVNPISLPERCWRWCRRNPAPAGTIASVALLLIALAVGSSLFAAVQASARRSSDNARKEIEEVLAKNQELLSRAYAERGERYFRVAETSDDYAPLKSLPWLLEAMKLDDKNPRRLQYDRIRLQSLLESSPRVERMWSYNGKAIKSGVSPMRDAFFIVGDDGNVKIWKTQGERPPLVLTHLSPVSSAAFSPDGARLATGSADGLRIWNTESGVCTIGPVVPSRKSSVKLPFLNGYDADLISFSKSGHLLFTSGSAGMGQIWNADSGQPIGKPIDAFQPRMADFADSDRLLILEVQLSTRAYDVLTGIEKRVIGGGANHSSDAKVSSDGTMVATCSNSGRIDFWNPVTGDKVGEPLVPDSESLYSASSFSQDGKLFGCGLRNGGLNVWSTETRRLLWHRQLLPGSCVHLQFSTDNSALAVGRWQRSIRFFAALNGSPINGSLPVSSPLTSADWTASHSHFLAVAVDGGARLWNMESRVAASKLRVQSVHRAAISADGSTLAVAEAARNVCIVHSSRGELDTTAAEAFPFNDSAINALALTDNGSWLAISSERQVFILDTRTHKQLYGPLPHSNNVLVMRFTRDQQLLVCASYDGRTTVWELANQKKLYAPINVGIKPISVDIDLEGRFGAVAAIRGVTVWELATGKRSNPGFVGANIPLAARFLGNHDHILIGDPGIRPAQIYNATTGHSLFSAPHPDFLMTVDVSADRSQFLTAYRDGTARLWRAQDFTPASPPFEHPAAVVLAIVDTTKRFVLTMSQDQTLFLWVAASAELLSAVPLGPIQSRFGLMPFSDNTKPSAFFSRDNHSAYVLLPQGLLITLSLEADRRSTKEITADVALRTATHVDTAGGLHYMSPSEVINLSVLPSSVRQASASP